MNTRRRSSRPLILSFLLCCVAMPAHAGWLPQGNAVCRAVGTQSEISIAADASGGAYVVWRDERRGAGVGDVYAARIHADGSLAAGWPVDGRVLSASGTSGRPWPVVTSDGRLLVFWIDTSTFPARLYMQSVGGDGAIGGGFPADGLLLPLSVGGPGGTHLRAVSDGAEGAYLMWTLYAGFDALRVLRVTGTGSAASGWPADGVVAGTLGFPVSTWRQLGIVPDPAGGVRISFLYQEEDYPSGSSLIGFERHVRSDASLGTLRDLQPNGYTGEVDSHLAVSQMQTVPDGSGGAFVAWRVSAPGNPQFYMQHHLAAGGDGWPITSAPVVDALLDDGAGGLYLFGVPLGATRLELHRRDASPAAPVGWESGVTLADAPNHAAFGCVRSGPRVYAAWSTGTFGAEDLWAGAVEPDAVKTPGYAANGSAISDANGTQWLAGLAAGTAGDAFAAWQDTRSGGADVYVARLGDHGPIVDEVLRGELTVTSSDRARLDDGRWLKAWIEPPAPHDAHAIEIASLRMNGSVSVDDSHPARFADLDRDGLVELLVRFRRDAVAATLPAGTPAILEVTGLVAGLPFSAADTLPGGSHEMSTPEAGSLGMSPEFALGTTSEVESRGVVLAIGRSTPNPQHGSRVRIEVSLADGSPAVLELVDVGGRTRHREVLAGLATGAHSLDLVPSRPLPPGLYFVRLMQGQGRALARMTLLD